jgi:hypothetical protein
MQVPIPEVNEAIDPAYLEAGVRKERAKLWADIALIAWQGLNAKITIEAAEEAVGDKAGGKKKRVLLYVCSPTTICPGTSVCVRILLKIQQVGEEAAFILRPRIYVC